MRGYTSKLFGFFFAGILLCVSAHTSLAQPVACIVGVWTNDDETARIRVYLTKGGTYAGKVIWLKELTYKGKPKLDYRNPDEKLRSRPILGLIVLKGFKPSGDETFTGGTIYDPKHGKTYDCKMTCLGEEERLSIRGYVGISLIGRSAVWSRVE